MRSADRIVLAGLQRYFSRHVAENEQLAFLHPTRRTAARESGEEGPLDRRTKPQSKLCVRNATPGVLIAMVIPCLGNTSVSPGSAALRSWN